MCSLHKLTRVLIGALLITAGSNTTSDMLLESMLGNGGITDRSQCPGTLSLMHVSKLQYQTKSVTVLWVSAEHCCQDPVTAI